MLRAAVLTLTLATLASTASAATYLDAPAIGRTTTGFALYGGAPIGASDDNRASVLGGGGTEVHYGYAWDSGWSLTSVFGGARWSSRGPLAQTLHDRDASITEGYAGIGGRWVAWDSEVAPFIGAMLLLDYARVRGTYEGDATGLAGAARVGLRFRDHPWDVFGAVEVRHARLSAPYDESDKLITTRLSIVFGVAWESGIQ